MEPSILHSQARIYKMFLIHVLTHRNIVRIILRIQVGCPLYPLSQTSHCRFVIFALQGHCPVSLSQIKLVEPSSLQLQAVKDSFKLFRILLNIRRILQNFSQSGKL